MATHVIDGEFLSGTAVHVIARNHANDQVWAWERPVAAAGLSSTSTAARSPASR